MWEWCKVIAISSLIGQKINPDVFQRASVVVTAVKDGDTARPFFTFFLTNI
jgi:hypothetical protein